jgi:hypothetical protein
LVFKFSDGGSCSRGASAGGGAVAPAASLRRADPAAPLFFAASAGGIEDEMLAGPDGGASLTTAGGIGSSIHIDTVSTDTSSAAAPPAHTGRGADSVSSHSRQPFTRRWRQPGRAG